MMVCTSSRPPWTFLISNNDPERPADQVDPVYAINILPSPDSDWYSGMGPLFQLVSMVVPSTEEFWFSVRPDMVIPVYAFSVTVEENVSCILVFKGLLIGIS
jgi:hypothetical protein